MRATVLVRRSRASSIRRVRRSRARSGSSAFPSATRVGRVVDLEVDSTDPATARAEVERMCEQLLANPLIESYEIELEALLERATDRRRRLPRLQRRPRRAACARGARRGGGAVWHADEHFPTWQGSSSPAASRTATTSVRRHRPLLAGDASGLRVRRGRRPVLGICNGFQILCEAGLLPGALRPNASLSFICRDVDLRVERTDTPFTALCEPGQTLTIPIKHGEGLLVRGRRAPRRARRERADRPPLRGQPERLGRGRRRRRERERNVMGLMPHPEHAVDPLLGSTDGALILGGLVQAARDRSVVGVGV